MRVAVVGCGFMGQKHANAYKRMAGVELVAVCGWQENNREFIEETFGTAYFTSFDEMLTITRPQVVSICLPTYLHKQYTIRAAQAGAHVICEKPIATSLSDAEEMIEACATYGVQLYIAHVLRFFPSYQNIVNQINGGEVGQLGMVSTRRVVEHPGGKEQSWYNDDAKSGGVIVDLMIHDTDFVRSLLGEVESVYAMRKVSVDQQYGVVTYKFVNGTMANLEALWGFPGPLTAACRVAGKEGVIRYNSETSSSVRVHKTALDQTIPYEKYELSPLLKDVYQEQLEHFMECIQLQKQPIITVDDALEALRLSLAANHSALLGKPIVMSDFYNEISKGGRGE
ncbi:Gfo/Idh/MocA family protein [Paenibacillus yanchengensis]|uniref:Gfo/Idh/MocA family protein n=1 Tax=Paenibacillus yanchengensis TaxID=2035833 RepID=A0ABW4YER0_9BACL